jgi:hypothetical protein
MNILLPSLKNRARFSIIVTVILLELIILSVIGCD